MTFNINKKTVFLIVSGRPDRLNQINDMILRHHDEAIIYTAPSGNVGMLKNRNAQVDVVITDSEDFTPDVYHMVESILFENKNPNQSIIIVGIPPREEKFIDEIVVGRIYFLDDELKESEFAELLARALNYNSHNEQASFYLRYLATGDMLLKEGEKAEYVYILKVGELQAFNFIAGKKVILGKIEPGEFVGEMAFINNEPRSASIEALSDSQLIEVPIDTVDKILYKRPSWSKALMQTLSKRLKTANKIAGLP
jgi:chorismate mutase